MKILYIVRGPFGTGKTEFARTITDNVVSCWDYYHQYGQNEWNEKLKPYADEYCRTRAHDLVSKGIDVLAVTNSFCKEEDMDYFYELAKEHGYTVFCMVMTNRAIEQYKRPAPDNVVQSQSQRLKDNLSFYSLVS